MAEAARELVSFGEYARRRGVSRPYVSKLVKQGTIQTVEGKIDPALADEALRAKADVHRSGVAAANASRRSKGVAGATHTPPRDVEADRSANKAKIEREQLHLQLYQRRLDREDRKTLPRQEIIDALAKAFATLRVEVMRAPDRLATRLAEETDPRRVYTMMYRDLEAALNDLSDQFEALVEGAGIPTQ